MDEKEKKNTWKRFEVLLFSQISLKDMQVLSVNVWSELFPSAKYRTIARNLSLGGLCGSAGGLCVFAGGLTL